MDQVIPILPCADIRQQAAFYESLGFDIISLYTHPNPYVVVRYGAMELHFYGNKKVMASGNASMCFIRVENIEQVYSLFTGNLKRQTGKIPRSGLPRVSKVRDLAEDRRFTLTDPAGNTFYIGTPTSGSVFFRTLENATHAKDFAILYDLLYSKEDPRTAQNFLPRLLAVLPELGDMDRAKVLLIAHDIGHATGHAYDDTALAHLLTTHQDGDWVRIAERCVSS